MDINITELQNFYENIRSIVAQEVEEAKKNNKEDRYSSPELKNLFDALAKAQSEYKRVSFNRENPFYKSGFADLDALIEATRPALTKNGLSFIQQVRINNDGMTILHSILGHKSGEWIESRNRIVVDKNDNQKYGSTLSYQKRYAAQALLGITVSADPVDDDAEYVQQDERQEKAKGVALNVKYNAKDQSFDTITKEQLEELNYELGEYPDIATQILEGLRLQSLADLPQSKFIATVKRVREIKDLRNNPKK